MWIFIGIVALIFVAYLIGKAAGNPIVKTSRAAARFGWVAFTIKENGHRLTALKKSGHVALISNDGSLYLLEPIKTGPFMHIGILDAMLGKLGKCPKCDGPMWSEADICGRCKVRGNGDPDEPDVSSLEQENVEGHDEEKSEKFKFYFLPDVANAEEVCSYNSEKYHFLLSKNVIPINEISMETVFSLKYPLVMTAINKNTNKHCLYIALETGSTEGIRLISFAPPDLHNNHGDGSKLVEDVAFESAALDIICKTLSIDRESISKVDS